MIALTRTLRTAVLAAASPQLRMQMVEALSAAGMQLLFAANDGRSALEALANLRPDLLLADAQLPAMEGSALARRILPGFSLPVRPTVVLLRHPHIPLPDEEMLLSLGAILLDKPLSAAGFCRAVDAACTAPLRFSPDETAHADELLDELGVPDHRGRECLRNAALMCAADERYLHNMSKCLYPVLGEMLSLNGAQAERAMRHVIGAAWQSDKFENQYRIFADTVDASRGQPTCGEMISRLADILRSEG